MDLLRSPYPATPYNNVSIAKVGFFFDSDERCIENRFNATGFCFSKVFADSVPSKEFVLL